MPSLSYVVHSEAYKEFRFEAEGLQNEKGQRIVEALAADLGRGTPPVWRAFFIAWPERDEWETFEITGPLRTTAYDQQRLVISARGGDPKDVIKKLGLKLLLDTKLIEISADSTQLLFHPEVSKALLAGKKLHFDVDQSVSSLRWVDSRGQTVDWPAFPLPPKAQSQDAAKFLERIAASTNQDRPSQMRVPPTPEPTATKGVLDKILGFLKRLAAAVAGLFTCCVTRKTTGEERQAGEGGPSLEPQRTQGAPGQDAADNSLGSIDLEHSVRLPAPSAQQRPGTPGRPG